MTERLLAFLVLCLVLSLPLGAAALLTRLLDTLLTLFAWAGFGWLIYQGLINVLQVQPDAGPRPLNLSINTISMYALIATANGPLLILWAQYNRYRFSVERRTRRGELSNDALAGLLGVAATSLQQMQETRSIVVSHDGDGNISDVQARYPRSSSASVRHA